MKKKICFSAACIGILAILTGCSSSMSYDDYNLDEYLEVGEYKNLQVAPYAINVTDEEIKSQIDSELESAKTDNDLAKGSEVKEGDTVNIDYVGKIGGKKFDGGSAEGYDLKLGSGSFIDGFESGLVGKKVGDEDITLSLKFPDDYNSEEVRGKDVTFTVKINSATREEIPQYDLDFIKNTTDYDTKEEYEAAVKEKLYNEKEEEAVNEQKTQLWSAVLDNTKVKKYPDREVEHYIEFNSDQMDQTAKSYGISREDVLAQYDFGDEEEFAAVNEDSSKLRVKQEMLIEYIAKEEGLEYTDKEKKALIENFNAQGFDEDSIETQTGRTMGDYTHIELLYEKVLDFLLENADITGAAISK